MKVAVIGAGIAGNLAAYRLHRDHDVTLFEANDYLGGHTHTHQVEDNGRVLSVDSGFIVFNDATYPHFTALLRELGVDRKPTEMSFSVHCERTGFEYCGSNLNGLFAQRRNLVSPRFHRQLRDTLRFNREARALIAAGDEGITLAEYLRDGGYGRDFADRYLLPMGAAIWSADRERMLEFPALFTLRFFHNHGLLDLRNRPQWYVVEGGSRSYVDKLTEGLGHRIRRHCPVSRVRRLPERVEVTADGDTYRFDAVFLACHSDQALKMLADPSAEEKAVLGAISYQRNSAVLHRGAERLPDRPRAWSSWNFRLPESGQARPTVTYYMNRLQGFDSEEPYCVTLNSDERIDDDRVIAAMTYEHPVFTREGLRAQQRQAAINGPRRTFYCGAYWRHGFHEDGVVSALNALDHFNQWRERHEQQSLRRAG